MNYSFLFLFLFFFKISTGQTANTKSIKVWSPVDTLNWGDFKGLDDGSEYAAYIFWQIQYNIIDSTKFEIYAWMDRKKSWWRIPGRHLLRHEQYHFNIAEIFARLIRKNAIEKKLSPYSYVFQNSFNKYIQDCIEMEKQYDKTTNHSVNEDAQQIWEDYIDKQLKKLEQYNASVITLTK